MSVFDEMFYDPRDEWIVLDEAKWESSRDSLPADRVFPWNVKEADLAKATRLRFLVDGDTEFPSRIFAGLSNVRELGMPGRWCASLTANLLPPKLRLLALRGEVNVKWPSGLVLPELQFLTHSEGQLQIAADQVSGLRGLAVDVGGKSKMTALLASFPKLVGLHLVTANDEKALAASPLSRLEHLGIVGGKLPSIKGLAGSSITSLQLKNLAKLTSLAGIEQIPNLAELDLQYLKNVQDLNLLLTLPTLTKVSFTSTGSAADVAKISAHVESNRLRTKKST